MQSFFISIIHIVFYDDVRMCSMRKLLSSSGKVRRWIRLFFDIMPRYCLNCTSRMERILCSVTHMSFYFIQLDYRNYICSLFFV